MQVMYAAVSDEGMEALDLKRVDENGTDQDARLSCSVGPSVSAGGIEEVVTSIACDRVMVKHFRSSTRASSASLSRA